MIRTFRYAFILAKVYGLFARSFVGESYREILRLKSVEELYDKLFPGARPDRPPEDLTGELERSVTARCVRTLVRVLDACPHPVLVQMLRRWECQSLKAALRRLAAGLPGPVDAWDLGRYGTLDLSGGDHRAAISKSPYAWVLKRLADGTAPALVENEIDRGYYRTLCDLVRALPPRDRAGVSRLVSREVGITNALWALRLRFTFRLDTARADTLLLPSTVDRRRRAAREALEIPAESVEGWRKWRYGDLLDAQLGESFSQPDPVRFEQSATRTLYILAHRLLHQDPFTLTPLAAFFSLKAHEARLLSAAAEALRLSVPAEDVLTLVGAG
jgi:vacuolar-type H+-ATPase subunit C/Vma6